MPYVEASMGLEVSMGLVAYTSRGTQWQSESRRRRAGATSVGRVEQGTRRVVMTVGQKGGA
jgi:hypothetical protein